jgi:hypothetical protein
MHDTVVVGKQPTVGSLLPQVAEGGLSFHIPEVHVLPDDHEEAIKPFPGNIGFAIGTGGVLLGLETRQSAAGLCAESAKDRSERESSSDLHDGKVSRRFTWIVGSASQNGMVPVGSWYIGLYTLAISFMHASSPARKIF